ncbi:MAG: hypothetical protein FJX47_11535 [Alphaproteobacteria bacterium]|nr:hypothetical protein [Alphaproteobacteria bacterium]
MGRMLFLLVAGAMTLGASLSAAQEKRVALIIGNDAYKTLPALNNAVADARAMDRKLKEVGFQTILRTNAGRTEMGRAISEFGGRIGSPDTVGLVFYSGHGIQAFERNWLIPVDAALESDVDLQTEALDAQRILSAMDEARNPLNILILDACRDNPLPRKGRSASRGLAVVSIAPRGSFIAYSASPNQKADDGNPGSNGVYTSALLRALDQPGLSIEQVFKQANGAVQRATGGRQVPWFNASIQGDFYFRPGAAGATPSPLAPAPVDPAAIELAFWDSIKGSSDVADFEEYLRKYPAGQFAGLARNKMRALKPELRTAAVTLPPPSRDTQARPVQPAVGTYPANPGRAFRDCPDCPEMVIIPAGRFTMGSPTNEEGRFSSEPPQREVSLRSFALGKMEVTFAEYDACAAENVCPRANDQGWGRGTRPVINVSWNDANSYAVWLSQKSGKTYRLPSESEWEYAARAGTTTRFSCGNDDGCLNSIAWYNANSGNRTQPVGGKAPNAFGLHDMHGNVWEWVEDCFFEIDTRAPTDGRAMRFGNCDQRGRRGGSWGGVPVVARSALRNWNSTDGRRSDIGFRVARTLN